MCAPSETNQDAHTKQYITVKDGTVNPSIAQQRAIQDAHRTTGSGARITPAAHVLL